MTVYVLYDCVENPDEWAFAGIEHVYFKYEDAYSRMKQLYEECTAGYPEEKLEENVEHFIEGYSAKVADGSYHHVWTISKEEVI